MALPTQTPRRGGALPILVATVVAGVAGYLVTFAVYRQTGPAAYAVFAVFWATLYLLIGGLSGVQQEITRATRAVEPGSRSGANRARTFGVVLAIAVGALIIATAAFWVDAIFPDDRWTLVWPLAVGVASYVLVATLAGSLYGISQWRSIALLISTDALLRLVFVGTALLLQADVVAVAWAVAIPLPLTVLVLWPMIRGGFVGRTALDVGIRGLSRNVFRTVAASLSTAVLVSGFPLLLGVLSNGIDEAMLGELIFTITLIRAPLIVTVMSLQGVLIVRLRDDLVTRARTLATVGAVIGAGAVVLSAGGWLLGPEILSAVSGRPSHVSGGLIAVLVASSAAVAALTVSGSAVLAAGRHVVYMSGWSAAALVTVASLLVPAEFVDRVILALLAGPAAGLLVHGAWLLLRGRRRATT